MTALEIELLAVLRLVEWQGRQRGPGSGYMDSGGDGELVPACPVCRQVNPADPRRRLFLAEAVGHKPDCRLARGIERGTQPEPRKER